jgi:hypothetical protein
MQLMMRPQQATRCALRRANSGVRRLWREIACMLICGTTTWRQPSSMPGSDQLDAVPQLPARCGGTRLRGALAGAGVRAGRKALRAGSFHLERMGHNFGRRAQVRCRFAGNLTTVLITSNTGSPRSHVSCPRMFNAQDPNSHITQFMVLVPAGRRTLWFAFANLSNPAGNWPKCLAVVESLELN